jgi:hypothetical protein
MNKEQLETKTDQLMLNVKELYNLDIVNKKQYHELIKKVKCWWYDNSTERKDEGQ